MKKKIAVLASLVLFTACLSYRGFDIVKNDLILKMTQESRSKTFFSRMWNGVNQMLGTGILQGWLI